MRGILVPDADSVRFQPEKIASAEEIAAMLARAKLAELPSRDPAQPITRAELAKAIWVAMEH